MIVLDAMTFNDTVEMMQSKQLLLTWASRTIGLKNNSSGYVINNEAHLTRISVCRNKTNNS